MNGFRLLFLIVSALFSAALAGFLLPSCSGNLNSRLKEMEPDTVRFTVKVRFSSSGDCEPDSQACTFIRHQYPMFTGLKSRPLQAALERWQSECFFGGKPDESGIDSLHREFMESFLLNHEEASLDRKDWREEHLGRVVNQNRQWICLEYFRHQYIRGEFRFRRIRVSFLDKKTGRTLRAGDFFSPENLKTLSALAETEFRKSQNLSDTSSLYRNGFAFGRDRFTLPASFWFTGGGMRLYFNPGELCSEERGGFEVQIPGHLVASLVRPGMLPAR